MPKILTYIEAISEGLREEMRRDPSVFLLGEDIGTYGGAFKVTKGFFDEFGENRVIDTVLAEAAIIGAATGAAIAGMRPVAEMQFADFVTNGFNQIVNMTAKYHYRNFVPIPLVVRLPSGGGIRGGPFHSSNPEAWFVHTPGLKVVAPSTAYDAKGLIKSAVRDNNPVVYLEHKYLYRHIKGEVPDNDYTVPIGKADIKREGNDISVITYHTGVHWALEAAATLSNDGIEVEVIDLRTLLPLDRETILNSVKKTGKVLIVHEASLTGGIGGEIAAIISENAFEHLDAPIRRLASLDTLIPYAPTLEDYFLPNTQKVSDALRNLARY
ncbi:MAG: alpha-ketoacid dehydrogenase subunit beta [Ignavibacteriae bacterium]|nr:alpha-ketoacid dehydrogenase subunit beta [Ignavibacteria bacterium]MBI3364244.1 alpha-ketoacid dehydrogenase subunit beta [Ignavibacteriota bacterium]